MWIRWRFIRVEGTDIWNYHELPDEMQNKTEAKLLEYLSDDGIRSNYWTGTYHLKGFEWERVPQLPIEEIQARVDHHKIYRDAGYANDFEKFEEMLAEVKAKESE
jgi:hypothetical protein